MFNGFKDKTILVTGGTGTIGSEIVRQALLAGAKQVRVLSRDDTKQYYLQEKLGYPENLRLLIGDIRDKARLDLACRGCDIIFHAAALKHVSLSEYNPFEAVQTNVVGSQNVIESALKNNVDKVIGISTDKAVNPVNVMGTTKLLMEKLFVNANYYKGNSPTKFSCVRFGNVVWARGSVLPIWATTAKKQGVVRITSPEMSRFLMSQQQAVSLVLKAALLSQGGEIFILKMPSCKLGQLCDLFLEKYFKGQNIKKEVIGERAGEKMYEDLFDKNDKYKQILENQEMFIIVPDLPISNLKINIKNYPGFDEIKNPQSYSSEKENGLEKIKEII